MHLLVESKKPLIWLHHKEVAPMASFFSRLKVELIYAENYRPEDEAGAVIFEYIELFYNRKRRHSAIGYLSPAENER